MKKNKVNKEELKEKENLYRIFTEIYEVYKQ